jgi:magnesium transporter
VFDRSLRGSFHVLFGKRQSATSFFQVQVELMAVIKVVALAGGMVRSHPIEAVEALLTRDNALVWVDIPEFSEEAVLLLTDVLKCHPVAVRDRMQRNRVPRVRIYPHQQLLIPHGPERGPSGHVHYLELDQIIGEKYLVTVHGPINPTVTLETALRETVIIRRRLEAGRLQPSSSWELSHAITSALTHRLEGFIEELTSDVRALEQRVTGGHMGNPEEFLEELFQARQVVNPAHLSPRPAPALRRRSRMVDYV